MVWPKLKLIDDMEMETETNKDYTGKDRLVIPSPITLHKKSGTHDNQQCRPAVEFLEQGDVCLLKIEINAESY